MIYAKYNGRGYVQGIPACDLSKDEWDALSKEQQATALALTHEIVRPVRPARKAAAPLADEESEDADS